MLALVIFLIDIGLDPDWTAGVSNQTTPTTTVQSSAVGGELDSSDYRSMLRNPEDYNGKYVTLVGTVEGISVDKKAFSLSLEDYSGTALSVECDEAIGLGMGDRLSVYGKVGGWLTWNLVDEFGQTTGEQEKEPGIHAYRVNRFTVTGQENLYYKVAEY